LTAQPSSAEYGVLMQEINNTEATIAQLELVRKYADAPSPSGNHRNLLAFLQAKNGGTWTDKKVDEAITAERIRLGILQEALADWNEREQVFFDAQAETIEPAADPVAA